MLYPRIDPQFVLSAFVSGRTVRQYEKKTHTLHRRRLRTISTDQYHLGTSVEELQRLGYQHQVWMDVATSLWRDAGFTHGQRLLDLGCGPGFATTDLAHLVGRDGHVDAVDNSDNFLQTLKSRCENQQLANVTAHLSDVHKLPLEDASVDGAFVRWLMCFVADPAKVIAEAGRVLRPGSPIVILDYFNYMAARLFPRRESFEALFQAYHTSAVNHGGSYDIGEVLPAILVNAGFRVAKLEPVCRVAKPGSPVWRWFTMFTENYLPKLVEQELLTPAQRDEVQSDLNIVGRDPSAFFFSPPMLGIIAYKR